MPLSCTTLDGKASTGCQSQKTCHIRFFHSTLSGEKHEGTYVFHIYPFICLSRAHPSHHPCMTMFVRTNCFVVCVCLLLIHGWKRAYAGQHQDIRRLTPDSVQIRLGRQQVISFGKPQQGKRYARSQYKCCRHCTFVSRYHRKDYGGIGGLKTISVRAWADSRVRYYMTA